MEFLETGKLKSDFLEKLLGKIDIKDEKIIVGPGIGEDAAVIDMGQHYMIVKSDPITFVSERIGWYVVNVNANDIAAMGGVPRWFLVTMLLPQRKTTINLIEKIMKDLRESCTQLGVTLIGGHTEITHGLENPILVGTMLGEVGKETLITNKNIGKGDLLYMTKGVAIEATSIIARERKNDIIGKFGEAFYKRCLSYLEDPGISVVSDARRIRRTARVTGMHDPTEGGILAGAYEMARASDRCLEIYIENIPVYEETRLICDHFHISPFNSIASGSLLISIPQEEKKGFERSFDMVKGGIPYLSLIGTFGARGDSVCVLKKGEKKRIHPTGKDEVTKLL
jgi:hydrogenase maturation factor